MAGNPKLKVMISTEGTYPFSYGGVSTWCDVLVRQLPSVDYIVYSVIMNPYVSQKFELPPKTALIKVPLWGTEDASEHLVKPFHEVYLAKRQTNQSIIRQDFLPLFISLVEQVLALHKDSLLFSQTLYNLYRYFQIYDYRDTFKDETTWDIYKKILLRVSSNPVNRLPWPSVFDLIQSLGWIYRFFTVLNTPVPKVDVAHSAAAAFCGIPCVLSKMENRTPFLLTEHGVYLREQYLAVNRLNYSPYLKAFLIRLVSSITNLNYYMADQISPVCSYNTRWEKEMGVEASRIQVIYNGVDDNRFLPIYKENSENPMVVTIARIDPAKDLITLLRAAAKVRSQISGAKFFIYGEPTVAKYYEECLEVRRSLGLEGAVIFAGHTNDIPGVLGQADLVALSSMTEAFPYSVVEAMMAGKAVVATDVGGVEEALGDCGVVVPPRQPEEMAQAIVKLLKDTDLRRTLEEKAHRRAAALFTLERSVQLYYRSYRKLFFSRFSHTQIQLQKQKLEVEKAYALLELGYFQKAIEQFKRAIREAPNSSAIPVILTEISAAYHQLGQFDLARVYLTKAQLISGEVDDLIKVG